MKSSSYSKQTLLRLAAAFTFILPLLWMFTAALHKPGIPLPRSLQLFPTEISFNSFGRVLDLLPIGKFILNSGKVIALALPLTLTFSSWAGFSISQLSDKAQRRWIIISLAVLMVPGIALWSTRFFVYKALGIYNSIWALVAPAFMGTSPFYVLMFYRAFRRIPQAIYDVARLDGAGVLQLWWKVALPMVRPTAIGVALLSFIHYWGDFTSPLLYLESEAHYTLPIALHLLQQMSRTEWSLLMAASVIATAIPTVLFLSLQPLFASLTVSKEA